MRVFARSDVYKLPVSVVTVQNRIIACSEIEKRLAVGRHLQFCHGTPPFVMVHPPRTPIFYHFLRGLSIAIDERRKYFRTERRNKQNEISKKRNKASKKSIEMKQSKDYNK